MGPVLGSQHKRAMVKGRVSVSTDVREHREAATGMGKAGVGATIHEMEKTSVVQKPE